jgi:hypothetical protein
MVGGYPDWAIVDSQARAEDSSLAVRFSNMGKDTDSLVASIRDCEKLVRIKAVLSSISKTQTARNLVCFHFVYVSSHLDDMLHRRPRESADSLVLIARSLLHHIDSLHIVWEKNRREFNQLVALAYLNLRRSFPASNITSHFVVMDWAPLRPKTRKLLLRKH